MMRLIVFSERSTDTQSSLWTLNSEEKNDTAEKKLLKPIQISLKIMEYRLLESSAIANDLL